jgi:hypothetical protein
MSNKYVFFKVPFWPIHFLSSQMNANSNPGQFLMSYSNGFAGSSPKLASKKDSFQILTAGKRRSTVGPIGNFRPVNLDLLVRHKCGLF